MHRIVYTNHVVARMRQRRITRRMIELTLSSTDQPYRSGKIADEEIAERRFGKRVVQVGLRRTKDGSYRCHYRQGPGPEEVRAT